MNKYTLKARRNGDEDDLMDMRAPFHVSCMEMVDDDDEPYNVFNIYVCGPILDVKQFIPALEALQACQPEDVVRVQMQTPGGDVEATDAFVHAINECATDDITFIATGSNCSAGTIILLNCKGTIQFSENCSMMIHNGSMGMGSKFSDFKACVGFAIPTFENFLTKTYKGFHNEAELDKMLEGREWWMDGSEFKMRLQKRNEMFG